MPMMIMVLIMKSDIFVQKLGCNKAQEEPAEEGLRERSLGESTILSSSSKRSLSE